MQNLTKIGLPVLARQMGEVSVFFLTSTQSVKQFLTSRVQITNIEIC